MSETEQLARIQIMLINAYLKSRNNRDTTLTTKQAVNLKNQLMRIVAGEVMNDRESYKFNQKYPDIKLIDSEKDDTLSYMIDEYGMCGISTSKGLVVLNKQQAEAILTELPAIIDVFLR